MADLAMTVLCAAPSTLAANAVLQKLLAAMRGLHVVQGAEGSIHKVEAKFGPDSRATLHMLEVGHTVALTGLHVTTAGRGVPYCTWTEVMHLHHCNPLSFGHAHDELLMALLDLGKSECEVTSERVK